MIDPDFHASRVGRSIWASWLMIVLALSGLSDGAVLCWQAGRWVAQAVPASAEVADFKVYAPDRRGSHPAYQPIVTYADVTGKSWQAMVGSSSYPAAYKVGDKLEVLYVPGVSAAAYLNTTADLWGGALLVLLCSGLLLLIAVVSLFWNRAVARDPHTRMPWWDQWFLVLKPLTWLLGR